MAQQQAIDSLDQAWKQLSYLAAANGCTLPDWNWMFILSDPQHPGYWQVTLLLICCQWQQQSHNLLQQYQKLNTLQRIQARYPALSQILPSVGLLQPLINYQQLAKTRISANTSTRTTQPSTIHQGTPIKLYTLVASAQTMPILPLQLLNMRWDHDHKNPATERCSLILDILCYDSYFIKQLSSSKEKRAYFLPLQILQNQPHYLQLLRSLQQHLQTIQLTNDWAHTLYEKDNQHKISQLHNKPYINPPEFISYKLGDQNLLELADLWQLPSPQPQHDSSAAASIYQYLRLLHAYPAAFCNIHCRIDQPHTWQRYLTMWQQHPHMQAYWYQYCKAALAAPEGVHENATNNLHQHNTNEWCRWLNALAQHPELIKDSLMFSLRFNLQHQVTKNLFEDISETTSYWNPPNRDQSDEPYEKAQTAVVTQPTNHPITRHVTHCTSQHTTNKQKDSAIISSKDPLHLHSNHELLQQDIEETVLACNITEADDAIAIDPPDKKKHRITCIQAKKIIQHDRKNNLSATQLKPITHMDLSRLNHFSANDLALQPLPVIDLHCTPLYTPDQAQAYDQIPVWLDPSNNPSDTADAENVGHINTQQKPFSASIYANHKKLSIYSVQQIQLNTHDLRLRLNIKPAHLTSSPHKNNHAQHDPAVKKPLCDSNLNIVYYHSYHLPQQMLNLLPDNTKNIIQQTQTTKTDQWLLHLDIQHATTALDAGWHLKLRGCVYHPQGLMRDWNSITSGRLSNGDTVFHPLPKNINHYASCNHNITPNTPEPSNTSASAGLSDQIQLTPLAQPSPVLPPMLQASTPYDALAIEKYNFSLHRVHDCFPAWELFKRTLCQDPCYRSAANLLQLQRARSLFLLRHECIYQTWSLQFSFDTSCIFEATTADTSHLGYSQLNAPYSHQPNKSDPHHPSSTTAHLSQPSEQESMLNNAYFIIYSFTQIIFKLTDMQLLYTVTVSPLTDFVHTTSASKAPQNTTYNCEHHTAEQPNHTIIWRLQSSII